MPSILLVNDNKIVSRLLQLSSQKQKYNLNEVTDIGSASGSYDVVFVDSDMYSEALLSEIQKRIQFGKLGYIGSKQESQPGGFDLVIEKPFLPTDFVELVKSEVIEGTKEKPEARFEDALEDGDDDTSLGLEEEDLLMQDLDENAEEEDDLDGAFDLDNLDLDDDVNDLLSSREEMADGAFADLEEEDDDIDLSLNSAAVMTTGVAASMMAAQESDHESLAEMVNEIDDMDTETELDSIETMDLDSSLDDLDDMLEEAESEVDLSQQTPSKIEDEDDEMNLETLDEELADLNLEDIDNLDEIGTLEDEDVQESEADEEIEMPEEVEALDETLMEDDEVGIESEDEAATSEDDFSSLDDIDEVSMQHALGELKPGDVVEEVISEETFSDGEETVVEFGDMESMIKDAVTKALTPELLREALDGMDLNVSISFNKKSEES